MGFGYAQSPLPQGDRLSEDARMTRTIGTMRPALLALIVWQLRRIRRSAA
jgi:hypothetical protein